VVKKPVVLCFLWLAGIITLAHSILPHHHHDEGENIFKITEHEHHSDLADLLHHVHHNGSDESVFLTNSFQPTDLNKSFSFSNDFFISSSHIPEAKALKENITDYGEPPPEPLTKLFCSSTAFRGPPSAEA
jgi:hypothetical protein